MRQMRLMPNRNKILSFLRRQLDRISGTLHSSRGKDILIFLAFACVSYVFWVVMSLNDDSQRDINVRLEIEDVPDDISFISELPEAVVVNVRDKGSVLANYFIAGAPTLKVKYGELLSDPVMDRVLMGEQELGSRVRALFGSTTQIVDMHPDSLSFIVTDTPGRRVPVVADIEALPSARSVISGPIRVEPDSVTVYTARHLAVRLRAAHTVSVSRSDLTDTLVMEVRLRPESGVRMVPDRVKVTIPVEPLIAKQRSVSVAPVHMPESQHVVLFPSQVTVSYLVPMSLYNSENALISVFADYNERSSTRIPLSIGAYPRYYHGVSLSADSVEYLIEQKTSLPAAEH